MKRELNIGSVAKKTNLKWVYWNGKGEGGKNGLSFLQHKESEEGWGR